MIAEFGSNSELLRVIAHSPQEELNIPLFSETRTAKVMWWNSLEEAVPITDAKTEVK